MNMELEIDSSGMDQTFKVKVVGVTYTNDDGINRQQILAKCKKGERINLRREYNNTHDQYAISVHRMNGEKLGYLKSDIRLAMHIDRNGIIESGIVEIIGGPTFFQKIFKKPGKSYGCVLRITKKGFRNYKVYDFVLAKEKEITKIIEKAKKNEITKPNKSVDLYKQAIDLLKEIDNKGIEFKAWRNIRFPIERLSLVLEKNKELQEAKKYIDWYLSYNDYHGLLKNDLETIKKRKNRLDKKLSKN